MHICYPTLHAIFLTGVVMARWLGLLGNVTACASSMPLEKRSVVLARWPGIVQAHILCCTGVVPNAVGPKLAHFNTCTTTVLVLDTCTMTVLMLVTCTMTVLAPDTCTITLPVLDTCTITGTSAKPMAHYPQLTYINTSLALISFSASTSSKALGSFLSESPPPAAPSLRPAVAGLVSIVNRDGGCCWAFYHEMINKHVNKIETTRCMEQTHLS